MHPRGSVERCVVVSELIARRCARPLAACAVSDLIGRAVRPAQLVEKVARVSYTLLDGQATLGRSTKNEG